MDSNPLLRIYTEPFVWGKNDCITATANYYQNKVGIDYLEEFRGKYATAYEAYRLLIKAGGMEGVLEKKGFTKISPLMALAGDVGIYYQKGTGDIMGVVDGRGKAVFAGGFSVGISKLKSAYRLLKVVENRRLL